MGNQHPTNTTLTGVLLFTLYQRGQPPRVWPCHLAERFDSSYSGKYKCVDMFAPLGAGSEADVFLSDLSVTSSETTMLSNHQYHVRFTFAGSAKVDAHLTSRPFVWSGPLAGPGGQPVALHVKYETAHLQKPYGEPMAQGSGSIVIVPPHWQPASIRRA